MPRTSLILSLKVPYPKKFHSLSETSTIDTLLKIYQLKTTNICYFTVYLVEESGAAYLGDFGSGSLRRLQLSESLTWVRGLLPSSFMWFGQEASISCHAGLSTECPHDIAAGFPQEHAMREGERVREREMEEGEGEKEGERITWVLLSLL